MFSDVLSQLHILYGLWSPSNALSLGNEVEVSAEGICKPGAFTSRVGRLLVDMSRLDNMVVYV